MEELQKEFQGVGEVSDFYFRQLKCSDKAYLYELTNSEGNKHYEVFVRKEQKEMDTVIAGVPIHYEAKVIYPKSNSFGVWAWCITDLKKAEEKFYFLNTTEEVEEVEEDEELE